MLSIGMAIKFVKIIQGSIGVPFNVYIRSETLGVIVTILYYYA
jgi:hypothetical protein